MRLDAVLDGLTRGDTTALARAISLVENQRDGFEQVLAGLYKKVGKGTTRRIGITGPPGAGKSTLPSNWSAIASAASVARSQSIPPARSRAAPSSATAFGLNQ
jgi:putative protein kinase ArgK-like GTPase of G3E family